MKKESIEEFLSRGGEIKKVQPQQLTPVEHVIQSSSVGPAVLLSLGEADLFYGEIRSRKAKAKILPKVDYDSLPEALRKKYTKEKLSDNQT